MIMNNEEVNKKISFVIPCYNSTHTIGTVVQEIKDVMQKEMEGYDYEIVLVNDGSPDKTTYNAIIQIVNKEKHIKGVDLARNFGQPSAVMAGLNYVTGDYVVCGDDDGQTPFNELSKLFQKIHEGYDLVEARYAVREKRSILRRMGTFFNEAMATWLIEKPRGLELTTYWVTKKFVVEQIIRYQNSYPYLGGLMLRVTQNACNVDVTHRKRLLGNSGYSVKKMLELWLNGFTSFSIKPLRIMSIFGFFVAVSGFIYGVTVIINKLLNPGIIAGYSAIMSVILFMFGILFFFMGMVGEYVGRIYMVLNKTPQFVVKDYAESQVID